MKEENILFLLFSICFILFDVCFTSICLFAFVIHPTDKAIPVMGYICGFKFLDLFFLYEIKKIIKP